MKYCPKCKRINNDNSGVCESCNTACVEIKDKGTPVFLLSAGGIERKRIAAALTDVNIPFVVQKHKKASDAESVLGADVIDADILVPFAVYQPAFDICVGIGAITPDGEAVQCDTSGDYEDHTAENAAMQIQQMSPAKRTTLRILSAIALILIFAAVIFGTDYVMALIKNMFM